MQLRRFEKTEGFIDLNLLSRCRLEITIRGDSPLVSERFSEKAIRIMEEAQQGEGKKAKKPPKNPEEEFLGAMHVIGNRPKKATKTELKKTKFGIPAASFKHAMVRGAKDCGGVMADAKGAFFVLPDDKDTDLVQIECGVPVMRTDPVRLPNGSADIRYRPEFAEWSCTIPIEYNARQVSASQLIAWCAAAGFGNGVGGLRPRGKNSSNNYGRWSIVKAVGEEPDFSEPEVKAPKKGKGKAA